MRADITNSNATVQWLQATHITAAMSGGHILEGVQSIFVDLDITAGTIAGNLTHLMINDDPVSNGTVGGVYRALWSKSTEPSLFQGTLSATEWTSPVDNQLAGTVTVDIDTDRFAVVGTGTTFTSSLVAGQKIKIREKIFTVDVITDDTNLTIIEEYTYNSYDSNAGLKVYQDGDAFTVLNVKEEEILVVNKDGDLSATSFILNTANTFATLPAGVQGQISYITDASSISYRGAAVGGGADYALVTYDGTNWIYH